MIENRIIVLATAAMLCSGCSELAYSEGDVYFTATDSLLVSRTNNEPITGLFRTQLKDGWRYEANYSKGELDGLSSIYYKNGQLKNQVSYSKGERNGLGVFYYETGQLMFDDGFPVVRSYFPNGQIKKEIDFEDKFWKLYDQNGQLKDTGMLTDSTQDSLTP